MSCQTQGHFSILCQCRSDELLSQRVNDVSDIWPLLHMVEYWLAFVDAVTNSVPSYNRASF